MRHGDKFEILSRNGLLSKEEFSLFRDEIKKEDEDLLYQKKAFAEECSCKSFFLYEYLFIRPPCARRILRTLLSECRPRTRRRRQDRQTELFRVFPCLPF